MSHQRQHLKRISRLNPSSTHWCINAHDTPDNNAIFHIFLFFCLLPCSSRRSLAGMPLRRCLLPTTRWATFPMTTKERWTCTLRLSPRLWRWTWQDSLRPGVGPSKLPLRRNSPACRPGVTTPWPSLTELHTAAAYKCRERCGSGVIQLTDFLFLLYSFLFN